MIVYKEGTEMANIKSAKKRVLITAEETASNKTKKTALKNAVKEFDAAVATGENVDAKYLEAVKKIDRAATKGLIKKNTAARKKSALAKKQAAK